MQKDIKNAVRALSEGKVILYPTDTVWGLGCDATDERAIEKIFEIKHRSANKSLIVLVSNFLMLREYVAEVPFRAVELMEEATRPITVIYPESKNLAPNLLAEDGSVGIRIPDDDFCRSLISAFGKPIVSTSANISGEKPTSVFKKLSAEIIGAADYVVSFRQDDETLAEPSSIIKVNNDGSVIKIR
ncbi:MAG: threonylcarbamoyl-AMP synthase [Bacteroidales bacterium]|nr:threonylcarbamoyl-AMP synthase [Bacteroidales bacterium]